MGGYATCVAPAPRWTRPARRSLGPCAALRVSAAAVLAFERHGSVKLTQLLPANELELWSRQLREAMHREELTSLKQNARVLLGEEALTDSFGGQLDGDELAELLRVNGVEVPFMQVFNLWRKGCDAAARIAFSDELRDAAAELLGCEHSQLRLYQDSIFHKRLGDAPTRWHCDLNMAPLDTNRFLTMWIPLQPVPAAEEGGSGLVYADGSHRDMALKFWALPEEDLMDRYSFRNHGAFQLGDVAVHHGWCLHAAPGLQLDGDEVDYDQQEEDEWGEEGEYVLLGPVSDAVDRDEEEEEEEAQEGWEEEEEGLWNEGRVAYTVSFFVDGATTLPSMERVHDEDADSYTEWLGDVGLGALARHAHLPVVVERCGLSS